ncbi:uncharacterized protein LOC133544250 [Nerophis ophidion]|uniref:uncharacterized protein LOC133544250 n=1 Tax=Nerophis ophidion TaxID=159077 RepID=UPI002ADFB1CF|nr:uncharacterized protein LOC133544250 [Nerophis ophidion]
MPTIPPSMKPQCLPHTSCSLENNKLCQLTSCSRGNHNNLNLMQPMLRNGKRQCKKLITSPRKTWKYYNQKALSSVLQPGDHVLIQNLSRRGGPGKICPYWEDKVHIVKERRGTESPVYVVRPLDGERRERVIHRNLLLPCPCLIDGPTNKHFGKPEKKSRPNTKTKVHEIPRDAESSSEDEYNLWIPRQSQGTPLNPHAPIFKPVGENHSTVEPEIEEFDDSSRRQDGDDVIQQGQRTRDDGTKDMQGSKDQDINLDTSAPELQGENCVMSSADSTSSEDSEHVEKIRPTKTFPPKI